MRLALLSLAIGTVSIHGPAAASKPQTPRIAVLGFQAKVGFAADKAELFTEFVEGAIRERGFDVIGKSDIDAMLGVERMKDMVGCDDASCMAEIGGALGVDEVVHGSIGRMGRYLLITAKRTSMMEARVLAQSTKKLKDGGDEALLDAIGPVVTKLFGVAPKKSEQLSAAREAPAAGTAKQSPQPQRTAPPGVRDTTAVPKQSEQKSSQEKQLDDIMRDGRKRASPRSVSPDSTVSAATEPDDGAVSSQQVPVLPVAVLSAGVVALGVAGYFQLKAWGHHKNATDEDYAGRQVETQSGRANQTYARVTAAGGAAIAAAGAVLWWLTPAAKDDVGVSALPSADGAWVLVSGGF